MKSHVFLTPMSPDGTPGELVEVQMNDGPVKYLEPLPYWSANDAALAKLKSQLAAAETDLRHAISKNRPPLEIQRLENILAGLKADLDVALYPSRKERDRQQVGADSPFSRNEAPHAFAELAASVAETVAAPPTSEVPAVKKKRTTKAEEGWEAYLKSLDERLAKRALDALRRGEIPARPAAGPVSLAANTCCTGTYLCSTCRAKAAAA